MKRRLKLEDFKVGMLVTTTDSNQGTIYTIEEVVGFGVRLTYPLMSGGKVSGGWVDYSLLRFPSSIQIKRTVEEIDQWFDSNPETEGLEANEPIFMYYNVLEGIYNQMKNKLVLI